MMRTEVYLDPKCLKTTVVPAAIELCHREVSGYLMSMNRNGGRAKVHAAYPIITDKKCPTSVETGNMAALKRLHGFLGSMNVRILGGFHSHPDGPSKLSKSDLSFIEDLLTDHKLKEWLEVIVAVKEKEYSRKRKQGWAFRLYPRKIGLCVVTGPFTGYEVTLSGFWVKKEGKRIRVAKEAILNTNWKGWN